MRDGVLLSGVLHVFVLLLVVVGIPWFWEPEDLRIMATPVTVVSSDQLTAPKAAQPKKAEKPKEEPPQQEIPEAPPAPTLPEPVVTPEPPTVPEEAKNPEPPKEEPNPAPQESANPQEEDVPAPVITEEPPKEEPPPPVPTETQTAEVQDVPVPPQKPEPPKKKEVKKKDEKKPVNQEQSMESLVDKLAKEQTAAVPPQEEVPAEEPQNEGIPQRLPASEEAELVSYIRSCWYSLEGRSSSDLTVTIEMEMNRDGSLLKAEIAREDRSRMSDPVYNAFARNALRAVRKCGADGKQFPINLQRDYGVWSEIAALFRESDFF
jgi:hypothetical protein